VTETSVQARAAMLHTIAKAGELTAAVIRGAEAEELLALRSEALAYCESYLDLCELTGRAKRESWLDGRD
jgi:hypothetical protein